MLAPMRLPALLCCSCLAVLLTLVAGCNDSRVPPTPRASALQDKEVREVKVVKVWDQGTDRLDAGGGDPHISHYIEVDVLTGSDKGKALTLPYDEWNVGKAPPVAGQTVMVAPMDWVRRDPNSQGRPFNGW